MKLLSLIENKEYQKRIKKSFENRSIEFSEIVVTENFDQLLESMVDYEYSLVLMDIQSSIEHTLKLIDIISNQSKNNASILFIFEKTSNIHLGLIKKSIVRDFIEMSNFDEKSFKFRLSNLVNQNHENDYELNYKLIFENSYDPILILENNNIIEVNSATFKILELSDTKDYIGKTVIDFSPEFQPDGSLSAEKSAKNINIALNENAVRFEWQHQSIKGNLFWVDVSLTKIIIKNREYIYCNWRDISEKKRIQFEREKQEEILKSHFENFPFGLCLIDHNGQIIKVNEVFEDLVGVPKLLNRNVNSFEHDSLMDLSETHDHSDHANCLHHYYLSEDNRSKSFESLKIDEAGNNMYLQFDINFINAPGGRMMSVYVKDITDEKNTFYELMRYSSIFEYSNDAIFAVNTDGIINHWNTSAERIFKFKKNNIVKKHVSKLFDKNNFEELEQSFYKIIENKQSIITELTAKDFNEKDVFLSLNLSPIFNDNADIEGISIIARNLTELKNAYNELWESNERFKAIFSEAADIIAIVNIEDIIIDINDSIQSELGYQRNEVIEKNIYELFNISKITNFNEDAIKVITRTYKIKNKNGKSIPMDLNMKLIPWGNSKAFMFTIRNVSDRWEAAEKIQEFNKTLEERVRSRTKQLESTMMQLSKAINMKDQAEKKLLENQEKITLAYENEKKLNNFKTGIINTVSHEYRTPLSVIFSSAEFIQLYNQNNDHDKIEKHAFKIMKSVDGMVELIDDVLLYGKINQGKYEKKYQEINIIDFIQILIDEMRSSKYSSHNFIFNKKIENGLIISDKIMIRHIVMNLLSNSVKYSDKGTNIFVTLLEDFDNFYISVKDEGKGIPEKDQEFIFNEFFRAGNSKHISGSGFGLSLVKSCVDNLNGTISMKSQENVGTEFIISLPKFLEEE